MAFTYKSATLLATESLEAQGTCLCICVAAVGGDSVFTLNGGDEINVRSGNEVRLNKVSELDKASISCISGQVDVLIEYSI